VSRPIASGQYVSGHHHGPTPWRCTGTANSGGGRTVLCNHPSHTIDPTPKTGAPMTHLVVDDPVEVPA
jgi:hypothetical protein